jgi:hypothetical protein
VGQQLGRGDTIQTIAKKPSNREPPNREPTKTPPAREPPSYTGPPSYTAPPSYAGDTHHRGYRLSYRLGIRSTAGQQLGCGDTIQIAAN